MLTVSDVQSRLPEYWTDGSYPDSFNDAPLPHRHFNHTITHAMKALGRLAALSDAMDHECMAKTRYNDPETEELRANAGKWLADLMICAARMSEKLNIDLSVETDLRISELIARWGGK